LERRRELVAGRVAYREQPSREEATVTEPLDIDIGPLRLITVYAPPEHPPGTVHQTKAEADAAEAAEAH
jgi:hypothetical protein